MSVSCKIFAWVTVSASRNKDNCKSFQKHLSWFNYGLNTNHFRYGIPTGRHLTAVPTKFDTAAQTTATRKPRRNTGLTFKLLIHFSRQIKVVNFEKSRTSALASFYTFSMNTQMLISLDMFDTCTLLYIFLLIYSCFRWKSQKYIMMQYVVLKRQNDHNDLIIIITLLKN